MSKKRNLWHSYANRYDGVSPYLHRMFLALNPRMGRMTRRNRWTNENVVAAFFDIADRLESQENQALKNLATFLQTDVEDAFNWLNEVILSSEPFKTDLIQQMAVMQFSDIADGGKIVKRARQERDYIRQATADFLEGKFAAESPAYARELVEEYQRLTDNLPALGSYSFQQIGSLQEYLLVVLLQDAIKRKLKDKNFDKAIVEAVGKGHATFSSGSRKGQQIQGIDSMMDITINLGEELGRFDLSLKTKTKEDDAEIKLYKDKQLSTLVEASDLSAVQSAYIKEAVINAHYWGDPGYKSLIATARDRRQKEGETSPPDIQVDNPKGIETMDTNGLPEQMHSAVYMLQEMLALKLIHGFETARPNLFIAVVGNESRGGLKSGIIRSSSVVRGLVEVIAGSSAQKNDVRLHIGASMKGGVAASIDTSILDLYNTGGRTMTVDEWFSTTRGSVESLYEKVQLQTNLIFGDTTWTELMTEYGVIPRDK